MDKVQACRRKAILAPRFLRAVSGGRSPVAHRKPTLTVLVTKGTYVMNTGDTASVLVATILVLFMTLPGLAMGSGAIGVLALKGLRSSGLSVSSSSLVRPDRFRGRMFTRAFGPVGRDRVHDRAGVGRCAGGRSRRGDGRP